MQDRIYKNVARLAIEDEKPDVLDRMRRSPVLFQRPATSVCPLPHASSRRVNKCTADSRTSREKCAGKTLRETQNRSLVAGSHDIFVFHRL